jgi:hypothetical protein
VEPIAVVFFLLQLVVLSVGFRVARVARRRPGMVSAIIGVGVVAGLGAFCAAAPVTGAYGQQAGWACMRLGQLLLAISCPAWLLVAVARCPRGTGMGPAGLFEWAELLLAYWFCCLILAILLGFLIELAVRPYLQFK